MIKSLLVHLLMGRLGRLLSIYSFICTQRSRSQHDQQETQLRAAAAQCELLEKEAQCAHVALRKVQAQRDETNAQCEKLRAEIATLHKQVCCNCYCVAWAPATILHA